MKIRNGFVSNSSSSSFTVPMSALTGTQLYKIMNHRELTSDYDAWKLEMDEHEIRGSTWMDNFDMEDYLIKIGVDMDKVKFGD